MDLDVTTWKDMYESEKKVTSELFGKIKKLDEEKLVLEENLKQLQNINNDLEQNITIQNNLHQEHDTYKSDVLTWKDKYETEKKSMSELNSKLEQLEKEKIDLEEKLKQLQVINDDLEQKIEAFKDLHQEYENYKSNALKWKDMYETEKKSITVLTIKIEQIEKEKLDLGEKLKHFQSENDNLKQTISTLKDLHQEYEIYKSDVLKWKDMYETEKKSTSEFESVKLELEERLKQCQIINDGLEKDVRTLKILQREHEHTLLAKNHSLKEKDHIVQMLQEKIDEMESANVKYVQLEEVKEVDQLKLKDMCEKAFTLERKIEEIMSENIMHQQSLREVSNERNELKNQISLLEESIQKLMQDLELSKKVNSELNTELEETKVALLKEEGLRKSYESANNIEKENINSLNSSLKQNSDKMSELENQVLTMTEKNTKLLENDLISKQVIQNLKKDISTLTSSLNDLKLKYSELCDENTQLSAKIKDLLDKEVIVVSRNNATEEKFARIKNIMENTFDLLEKIVKTFSGSLAAEQLENDLKSIKSQFMQDNVSTDSKEFSDNLLEKLKLFFKNNLRNEEEEHKIYNLICSISSSVNQIGQFVDSLPENDSPKTLCFADKTINVTFNESYLCEQSMAERFGFTHVQIINDLQQTQELLQSHFNKIQTIVMKQTDAYKDLKFKLDQASSKISNESQEGNENFVPKWKFKLMRVNAQRWEEKANEVKHSLANLDKDFKALKQKCKEQAEKINYLEEEKVNTQLEHSQEISKLEEDNKRLDEECEELGEEYKNLQNDYYAVKNKLDEAVEELNKKCKEQIEKINSLKEEKMSTELELCQRISKLEEENKRLNEECEELGEEYKNLEKYYYAERIKIDEAMDELKRKLDRSIKENDQLKTVLKKIQISPQENQEYKR